VVWGLGRRLRRSAAIFGAKCLTHRRILFIPETKAWPERPVHAAHRGHRRRDEAPQSEVRLCPYCQQINQAFGITIDKDVVRRALAIHFRPEPGADGPSWLTLIANAKDSVWSVDLFRVESILLRSHRVMLVMDVFTLLMGCRYAACLIARPLDNPNRDISVTDHDPLFHFDRWLANLRVLEVEEIKSVPRAPVSHPFVERLIGTSGREYLDRVFFWNALDLARKLNDYKNYYNTYRVHRSLGGSTPVHFAGVSPAVPTSLDHHVWRPHCRGLFPTPVAA
jgi:putative transposase